MSVLVGSLEAFALPDVFRLVSQNHQTGALKVERESGDGAIFFRQGDIYYAESSLDHDYLGQKVVAAKLVSKVQLMRLLDEQKKRGSIQLGELLVEKNVLSRDLLETFIKEQIQEAVFDLLQWDVGRFTFEVGATATQEVGLSVSVENLLMESARRLEEWEVIQRKIPTLDVKVRMSPVPPADTVEINIKPEEWSLLVLADGTRTVRDIAAASGRSEFDASKIIYGLVTAGLLEVPAGGPVPLGSEEEPSRLSPQDLEELIVEPVTGVPTSDLEEVQSEEVVLPEPVKVEAPATAEIRAASNGSGHTVSGMNESVATAAPPQQQAPPAVREQAEVPISKETLLRVIAGVRSL